MNPPANRRRKILWTMATLGAGLLAAALAAADWRLVRAEYHAFRLNRAQSREEAEPHLEALLGLASHAPAAWAHFVRWWGKPFMRIAHARALQETRVDTFRWFLDQSASPREPQSPVPLPGWEGPPPVPSYPDFTGIEIPLSEFFDP